MRNELASKTIAALKSLPVPPELADSNENRPPDYALLNDYVSAHWKRVERPEITDEQLIQTLGDISGPLLGIPVNADLTAMTNRLLPILDYPQFTTLLYRCVRALRYIKSVCGDDTLKQEIENALAVAVVRKMNVDGVPACQ